MDQQYTEYDEISLRELIEALLKHKGLIIGITAICILVSGIVSFFIMDPVYEAKTVLMASQTTEKVGTTEQEGGIEGILNTISEYPVMTLETYKQQLKNPTVLQETIDELDLAKHEITRTSLSDMIELETIQDTNLISIKVKNTDKALATEIANKLSEKFTKFVSDKVKEQVAKSSGFINTQLEVEKQKLDEALVEYKEFLSQPRGTQELSQEINSKISLLTTYKTDLTNERVNEEQLQAKISQAQAELNKTPDKIELNKSLSDEPYMSQVVNENTEGNSKDLFNVSIKVEEKNGNHYSLENTISNFKIALAESTSKQKNLAKEITNAQKELEKLQSELAEKQHEERLINRRIGLAESTYDAFTKKLEESRIAQSSAIGESSIIIISPAVEPLKPVGPRKALNLAIAAVLGIMIGVFIAFFIEYWKNSASSQLPASSSK